MASRARYLANRAAGIPKALATPVGVTAAAATVTGLVALLINEDAGRWLAALSLLLWLLTVLMLADRLRINAAKTDRPVVASAPKPTPVPATPAGPTALETRRLEAARTSLAHLEAGPGEKPAAPAVAVAPTPPIEPLVTVVVPCFNDGRYLTSCLESVKNQTYGSWECIVVDDASTDDSVATAWNAAKTDDRIRVVRHTRNRGLSAARNTGLLLAAGELVTFLDSDDLLTQDSLADRVAALAPHLDTAEVAGVFGGAVLAPDDATPSDYRNGRAWSKPAVDFVTSGDHCPFNVHAAITKTAVLRASGGFDESMTYGAEDWDLWYRVLRNGYRFVPSSLASAIYRQKPESMRQRHAAEHFAEAERLTEASQVEAPDSIGVPGPCAADAPIQGQLRGVGAARQTSDPIGGHRPRRRRRRRSRRSPGRRRPGTPARAGTPRADRRRHRRRLPPLPGTHGRRTRTPPGETRTARRPSGRTRCRTPADRTDGGGTGTDRVRPAAAATDRVSAGTDARCRVRHRPAASA